MPGFSNGVADYSKLQSTMHAIEEACHFIQVQMNLAEADATISLLGKSLRPYHSCIFILENSQVPNARFQAAAAIRDAAVREWGFLTSHEKWSLITFCFGFAMQHSSMADTYVQVKVCAVGAQLMKRGWLEFAPSEKDAFLAEVMQAVLGIHGLDAQYAGISFLESLVSEFSLTTSSVLGLTAEFHGMCRVSLEMDYLKSFYCWARDAVLSIAEMIIDWASCALEVKVCSAALRLMFQILNWDFQCLNDGGGNRSKINPFGSGARHHAMLTVRSERLFVQPGSAWHDVLLSSGHIGWLLSFYMKTKNKFCYDKSWCGCPLAVSARKLIVHLCSLTGSIFPSDEGETQEKHLSLIFEAIAEWINPPSAIFTEIRCGRNESEMLDGCRALHYMATLVHPLVFDKLFKSVSHLGAINLLSALTCEAIKAHVDQNNEDIWSSEALDILLDTWNNLLVSKHPFHGQVRQFQDNAFPPELRSVAASLFSVIVESELKASANSAYENRSNLEHFEDLILARDERLNSYAVIGRASANFSIPLLIRLFSEQASRLHKDNSRADRTGTLEVLYWLLSISGHVLADKGEGETPLVPEAFIDQFLDVDEEERNPVTVLSCSIISFSLQSQDADLRSIHFSPRLMEAIIWFLARWADTYLMAPGTYQEYEHDKHHTSYHTEKAVLGFFGQHGQGKQVLDSIVRIGLTTLVSYKGENYLHGLTCSILFPVLVKRKNVCLYLLELESWRSVTTAFVNDKCLLLLSGPLQRSLAESVCQSGSAIDNPDAASKFVRDVMESVVANLISIAARNDVKLVAQRPDITFSVCCLLERLRGAARATGPRIQSAIFYVGAALMNCFFVLLDAYKNQSAVVYKLLKFVADWVDGQVVFLKADEMALLVRFCLQFLETYSSQRIGKISLNHSRYLLSAENDEKCKDLRALLQLLTTLCSRELIDYCGYLEIGNNVDVNQIAFLSLNIITALISLDFLKYPKLCHDYFTFLSHFLEVFPKKITHLNDEAFAKCVSSLEFGIRHQNIEVVNNCLSAIKALASYHFKEKSVGKVGLGRHTVGLAAAHESCHIGILSHLLQSLLHLLIFEDYIDDFIGTAADALLPLILCEHDTYQKLGQELLEKQPEPSSRARLASALQSLTDSNQISYSLDRMNFQQFRKNLRNFVFDVSGFLRAY